MRKAGLVFIIYLLAVLESAAGEKTSPFQTYLNEAIDKGSIEFLNEGLYAPFLLQELYLRSSYKPLWRADRLYELALDEIARSNEHGLLPSDYHYSSLLELEKMFLEPDEYLFAREILISDGLLTFLTHLQFGKTGNAAVSGISELDLEAHIFENSKKIKGSRLIKIVDSSQPETYQYRLLKHYRGRVIDDGKSNNALEQLDKIDASMERLRLTNNKFQKEQWIVNIPSFHLFQIEEGRITWSTSCIVGKPSTPTPELSGELLEVVINPSWFVPQSIEREIFALALKDNTYLERNQFRIVPFIERLPANSQNADSLIENLVRDYNLIQLPGRTNPLGKVKVRFSNDHSIFLHDTPNKNKFNEKDLALSHGCIRVENIKMFLERLGYKRELIEDGLSQDEQLSWPIDRTQMIHLIYLTAFINSSGNIEFLEDIYDWDGPLTEQIRRSLESVQIENKEL